jgi:AcrR family transcriptional regulator
MAMTGGGRPKVEPDPQVRAKILSVALEIVRDDGVRGLGIAQVLDRAQLGTRAFYRHFDSKDQLVAAMFAEMARVEMQRLEAKMAGADPVRAVAAWIDGRLDLAFDAGLESDLRQMSLEAQSQMFASPKLIAPAYAEILGPLVDQINRGAAMGLFADVDPTAEALSIQGVVWAHVERQWATGTGARSDVGERVQRFCLRGLGVASDVIAAVVAEKRPTSKPLTRKKSVKTKQSR